MNFPEQADISVVATDFLMRDQYIQQLGELKQACLGGKSISISFHDGVHKNRFEASLDKLVQEVENLVKFLQQSEEFESKVIETRLKGIRNQLDQRITEVKRSHLHQQDEQTSLEIFNKLIMKIDRIYGRSLGSNFNPIRARNKTIGQEQQKALNTLFEATLSEIAGVADIHPVCFISYCWESEKNKKLVREIANHLMKAGIQVRIDVQRLAPGDDAIAYTREIKTCHYALVMGSSELYQKSEKREGYLSIELEAIAIKYRDQPSSVIPFLIGGDPTRAFPHWLGGGESVIYVNMKDEESYFHQILNTLAKLYEDSKKLSEIKAICEKFKGQEKFIISGKYPQEKLEKNLQEIDQRKKQEDAFKEISIDKILTNATKKQTLLPGTISPAQFNLKPPLEDFIICRKQLEILEKNLLPSQKWSSKQPSRLTVLTGSGGVGKSELACYFANLHLRDFSFICWINCETPEMRLHSYLKLAKALNLYLEPKATPEEVFKIVNHYLENHSYSKAWLLVFDSMEERIPLPKRGGSILGTSTRKDLWAYPYKYLDIPVFDEKDAVRYVKDRTGQNDENNIKTLIHELGCFPLAVAQSAALIAEAGIPVSNYLNNFRKNQQTFLQQERTSHQICSIITTWSLTLENLRKYHPQAFEWLNICAHLGSGKIPQGWTQSWLKNESKKTVNSLSSTQLLSTLQKYNIICFDPVTENFSLHNLLRKVISQTQGQEDLEFYRKAFSLLIQEGRKFDEDKIETMQNVEIWVSHAEALVKAQSFTQEKIEDQKTICQGIYRLTRWLGNNTSALEAANKIVEIKRRIYGTVDHSDIAASLNNLGSVLSDLGRKEEALKFFQESLEMQRRIYGAVNHSDIAASLNKLGDVLSKLGQKEEALKFYQESLEMQRKIYGAVDHRDIAASLKNLGNVLSDLGRMEEALKFFQESLEMERKIYDVLDHPDIAASLKNIGDVLLKLGREKESLKLYQESLEMQRRIYDVFDHSDIAASLKNLGNVLLKLGREKEAIKLYQESLIMQIKIYNVVDHPDIAASLHNLGGALSKLGSKEIALKYYQWSLEIQRRLYGVVDHPNIAASLNNLGKVLSDLGRKEEALKLLQESLEMQRKIYGGVDHPDIIISLKLLASVLSDLEYNEESLKFYQESLKMQRRIYGAIDHLDIASTLKDLGGVLLKLGRRKETLKLYHESINIQIRIYKKIYSVDNPTLAVSLNSLWSSLSQIEKLGYSKEAMKLYQDYFLELPKLVYASVNNPNNVASLNKQKRKD